jgi:hypothetical protein
MNCTICGKATSHRRLLCRPCKAALKRARQLTVQDVPQRSARGEALAAAGACGPAIALARSS